MKIVFATAECDVVDLMNFIFLAQKYKKTQEPRTKSLCRGTESIGKWLISMISASTPWTKN